MQRQLAPVLAPHMWKAGHLLSCRASPSWAEQLTRALRTAQAQSTKEDAEASSRVLAGVRERGEV